MIGQGLDSVGGEVSLDADIHLRGIRHHQVGLNIRVLLQHFQQTNAVDNTTGTGHTDNQPHRTFPFEYTCRLGLYKKACINDLYKKDPHTKARKKG